ncbi:hypothetical protein [Saccharothrix obliqua]|uniref:hypothetical protein n=1 Tax=Saccharothrix obliqua TaxID=2861747 RepID=UPI001C605C0B|nr:hypothetical protein [Saccharothrix obliqua]MBW4720468.1 hypothetical protein [Saccharothrix obliqua]
MFRAIALAVLLVAATAPPAAASPLTQITATPATPVVDAGQSTTISGRLTEETSPGVWTGLAGRSVSADLCLDPACTDRWGGTSTTTGADGWFSVGVTPYRSGYWRFQSAGASVTTGLLGVRQVLQLAFDNPVRQADGAVRLSGAVAIPSKILPRVPIVIRLQFSPDNATWSDRTTTTADYLMNGWYGYRAVTAEPASGYWRAVHDGMPEGTQPATTGSRHLI